MLLLPTMLPGVGGWLANSIRAMLQSFFMTMLAMALAGCRPVQRVQVALTNTPFTNQMQMQAGDSCEFRLPSGRTVAVWCVRPRSSWISREETDSKSGLKTVWGERAFEKPKELLWKIKPGHYAVVGYQSYIMPDFCTIMGDTARQYELSACGLRFTIIEDLRGTNSLPVTIVVMREQ